MSYKQNNTGLYVEN